MGADTETVTSEAAFRAAMPDHVVAAFEYLGKAAPWVLVAAIMRFPDLATVGLAETDPSGTRTEVWLSVMPDGEGGWSIQEV